LHCVLEEWVRLNRLLGKQWAAGGYDLPWWYNERALLSVFSGAIWNTGNLAFEEFSEQKLKGKHKKFGNGRVDLWFKTSGGEFRAEAKHAEIRITERAKPLTKMRVLMKRAVADAGCNPPDHGNSRRLAIAFGVPCLPASLETKQQRKQQKGFLEEAMKVKHDAIAYFSPSVTGLPEINGWVCPGIVIWLKLVKRSSG